MQIFGQNLRSELRYTRFVSGILVRVYHVSKTLYRVIFSV